MKIVKIMKKKVKNVKGTKLNAILYNVKIDLILKFRKGKRKSRRFHEKK